MIGILYSLCITGLVFISLMLIIDFSGITKASPNLKSLVRWSIHKGLETGEDYLRKMVKPKFLLGVLNRKLYQQAAIKVEREVFLGGWWLGVEGIILIQIPLVVWLGDDIRLAAVVVLLGGMAACAPFVIVRKRAKNRKLMLQVSFPDFLDLLSMTVNAGLGLLPALKRVSESMNGPMKADLEKLVARIEMGFSAEDALTSWAASSGVDDVLRFAEAVRYSQQLGSSLARTLLIQSDLMRAKRRRLAEEQVRTAPIRIVPALVFFFLPSLMMIYLAPPILNFLFR